MTQTETLPAELAEEIPDDIQNRDVGEMANILDDLNDRYKHRELHMICTGTDIMLIYDEETGAEMQIEMPQD
jgi:hypothetical protein